MNIFVFGASCSGKSTLATALHRELGAKWTYISRDDLIEKESIEEERADAEIERRLASHFIVDAQIPWRGKKEKELYFRVFPPLLTLLKRDKARRDKLKRGERSAYWAKHYVIETHLTLLKLPADYFNATLDSSKRTPQEEVDIILSELNSRERSTLCQDS